MRVTLSQEQLETFRRDGFVVIPGLFSPEEVAGIRDGAYEAAAEAGMRPEDAAGASGYGLPGDVSSHEPICHLVADERVVSIAEQLLGAPPIHFRDSAVTIGGTERGWHKDNRNADRYDTSTPDWDGDYPLVRMGIYCEDHVDHSGGLAVRVGSHLPGEETRQRLARARWSAVQRFRKGPFINILATGMLAKGRPVHVDSRAGDLVAWNMRITHSGHTVRLKGLRRLKLPPFVEQRLPQALTRGEERQRIAVFLTYAADSPHLARYLDWIRERAYFAPRTKDRPMCDQVAASGSLRILDPWSEAAPVA